MKKITLLFITISLVIIYSTASHAIIDTTNTDSTIAANSNVPIDKLTAQEIKRLFLGKTTIWKNGTEVKTCYLEDSSFAVAFIKDIIGKSAGAFDSYWSRQLFSGNGTPPEAFAKASEVVEFLNKNKGSICYLPQSDSYDSKEIKMIALQQT